MSEQTVFRNSDAETLARRGAVLHEQGRHGEALLPLDQALLLQPDLLAAHETRAGALLGLGRPAESLGALDEMLRLSPANALAWSHRGAVLQILGRTEEALNSFEQATALAPALVVAHMSRAMVLDDLQRFEESAAAWARVVALEPGRPDSLSRLAYACGRCGRHLEELAAYDAALTLRADDLQTQVNRAHCLLQLGRFREGWAALEFRKLQKPGDFARSQGEAWRGEVPAPGRRRLFVFHEEGAGDAIQFARFLPELPQRGFETFVHTLDPLAALFRTLPEADRIRFVAAEPDRFDYHCAMLSLPLALGVTLENLPARTPYLQADPARKTVFEARLGPRRRKRIGLAWSGNPKLYDDRNRSIPLARLAPLLAFDADWHALQTDIRASDRAAFEASGRVAFHGPALVDFADTAALADLMDLVIAVDTSVVHLAGALGKPVWVMLPFDPDWRWLTGRDDSPWYPSARLFRQSRPGDWDGVLGRVAEALAQPPPAGDDPRPRP